MLSQLQPFTNTLPRLNPQQDTVTFCIVAPPSHFNTAQHLPHCTSLVPWAFSLHPDAPPTGTPGLVFALLHLSVTHPTTTLKSCTILNVLTALCIMVFVVYYCLPDVFLLTVSYLVSLSAGLFCSHSFVVFFTLILHLLCP